MGQQEYGMQRRAKQSRPGSNRDRELERVRGVIVLTQLATGGYINGVNICDAKTGDLLSASESETRCLSQELQVGQVGPSVRLWPKDSEKLHDVCVTQ
jgi:hypothetical protein